MPRSAIKLPYQELDKFKVWLQAAGFELYTEPDGHRVLMFRKSQRNWTQGHTNEKRYTIRFSGPERKQVLKFMKKEEKL